MPAHREPLFLHQEIMLLALRDQEGTVHMGPPYNYAIGGAILAELLLAKRVAVEEGKKKLVKVMSDRPIGEPLIDECLEKIATAKRRATLRTWVQRFASVKQLKHRVARSLCDRRILRADEDRVLLLFRRKIYPEIDPRPERDLISRLRKAIFSESREIDPRTVVLVSLANSADLLRIPFDKKELKARKERIGRIAGGDLMGAATREAIRAARAAVTVACIVPAATASTVST